MLGSVALPDAAVRGAPDVIIVDVSTAGGLRAVEALAANRPAPRLVAVAAPDDDATIVACVMAGVVGFVAQEGSVDDVLAATAAVVRGDNHCPQAVAAALLRRVGTTATGRPEPSAAAPLTAREHQVLALIDDGLSNKGIATRLYIEVSTVKNHVHNLLAKLGARRRSEAAATVRRDSAPGIAAARRLPAAALR